jgi:hypothetical protein
MAGPDLLRRLDAALAELQAIRGELAAVDSDHCLQSVAPDADDLADACLLDTTSAQERFGHPRNTLAKWCREEGLGVRRGGRWLISIPRLQRHLNGGGR